MKNKVYKGVDPFTDVYYYNCFAIQLLAIIKYYGGDPLRVMVNNVFYHISEEQEDELSLETGNHLVNDLCSMLNENGIGLEHKMITTENLLDCIRASLTNDELVMLPVDGMYYKHPYHDLFYQKEHHEQAFLLDGYDDETETVKFIDVNGMEWNTHNFSYEHELKYQDLLSCYQGLIDYKNGDISPIKLFYKNTDFKSENHKLNLKEEMLMNLKNSKNLIQEGIEKINEVADNYQKYNLSTADAFGNKVAANSNLYMSKIILGENASCIPIFEELLQEWIIVEMKIYQYQYKELTSKKKFEEHFRRIIELEQKVYECIFNM